MTKRIVNFSAGPAVLPVEVLEEARANILSLGETGIGIMEHSHRGKAFIEVLHETEANCRKIANISDEYSVLFLTGGASTQFYQIPANFLKPDQTADYLLTGVWAEKATEQVERYGKLHIAGSSKDKNFNYLPKKLNFSKDPAYVHYTSNNTIYGTQFKGDLEVPAGLNLICDTSSDMCSRPIDVSKYAMIYAGAQKNLGPSGVTLVIIKKDFQNQGSKDLPEMLQYRTHADNESCYNTPPTFGIYIMGLVFKWILKQGGLEAVNQMNKEKAAILYDYLDQSQLFKGTAEKEDRSLMNIPFVTGNNELDAKFIKAATAAGFDGLKGHRLVGGMRASVYNAFPKEGLVELVNFMKDFEAKN